MRFSSMYPVFGGQFLSFSACFWLLFLLAVGSSCFADVSAYVQSVKTALERGDVVVVLEMDLSVLSRNIRAMTAAEITVYREFRSKGQARTIAVNSALDSLELTEEQRGRLIRSGVRYKAKSTGQGGRSLLFEVALSKEEYLRKPFTKEVEGDYVLVQSYDEFKAEVSGNLPKFIQAHNADQVYIHGDADDHIVPALSSRVLRAHDVKVQVNVDPDLMSPYSTDYSPGDVEIKPEYGADAQDLARKRWEDLAAKDNVDISIVRASPTCTP